MVEYHYDEKQRFEIKQKEDGKWEVRNILIYEADSLTDAEQYVCDNTLKNEYDICF